MCVFSGWDRTPLFISLLRLSLWADGQAHRELNAMQILYFTIGYDWMLFGHLLFNRLEKGEDVFYFAFDCASHIDTDTPAHPILFLLLEKPSV
jgi:myotubularin-related protein 14